MEVAPILIVETVVSDGTGVFSGIDEERAQNQSQQ
jgi:hypothetical protein